MQTHKFNPFISRKENRKKRNAEQNREGFDNGKEITNGNIWRERKKGEK